MATKTESPATERISRGDQMEFGFQPTSGVAKSVAPPEPAIPTEAEASMKKKASRGDGKASAKQIASIAPKKKRKKKGFATAESMSRAQREISVSEFFAKNRHLLGFDNKRKALLTTVKEAVDNSLDACEEAGILPDIHVRLVQTDTDRFCVTVRDNGPGIVKEQIPNIFGKLLYGSKFHRLKMSRGQQGIGISAAGMYGLLTTGKSIRITSHTGRQKEAHYYEVQIDTKSNAPQVVKDRTVTCDWDHGTEVSIELVASYKKGRSSVDEYLELTAIANPHVSFEYVDPTGNVQTYARGVETVPEEAIAIKPHPYGIELGVLIKMLKETRAKTMSQFLHDEFSRVSAGVAKSICDSAKIGPRARPTRIGTHEAETLYKAIQETRIRPPATNCLSPIGEEQILAGLLKGVKAEFFVASTRAPAVYRGNPFQIEVGLAYGGELGPDSSKNEDNNGNKNEAVVRRGKVVKETRAPRTAKLMRFANRVPLLHQLSGCCIYKSVIELEWRRYGLTQPGGNLPTGPLAIFVHMASVWVPFTSEGKEAIADYDEIRKEIRLAVQECGRKLQTYLNRRKRQKYQADRRSVFNRYIGELVGACASIKRINKQTLTRDLMNMAKRVTARADEELGLDGRAIRGDKAKGKGKGKGAPRTSMSSEYGENTIVVDRDEIEAGPLFGENGTSG